MLHIVEIDQSGKVEDTRVDTVIAFSNGMTYSISLSSTDKREIIQILRESGLTGKSFYLKIFTTLLFLLLKKHARSLSYILIDHEYVGKEAEIKQHLLHFFKKYGIRNLNSRDVQFKYIGKNSRAHIIAYQTFKKIKNADMNIKKDDILREFKEMRKPKNNRGPR